jgi:spore germination protein YaaH
VIAPLLLIPVLAAPAPKCSGWLVFYDGGASLADFRSHADRLDTVSVECFLCSSDGTVQHVSYLKPEVLAEVVSLAHAKHVRLLGMLQNPGFDSAPVDRILADPAKIQVHVKAIVDAVNKDGLDGLDLDYESLKGTDRDGFSSFVEDLATKLHAEHKLLSIALQTKVSEPGGWDGPIAQDWRRIGASVDMARVMCYDEHWETSEAGPVADPAWVAPILSFAVTEIPRNKLEIGVPGYGYSWVGKKGTSITYPDFMALPGVSAAVRDPVTKELVLSSGQTTTWFCDAKSEASKLELARRFKLRGVCLWRLGAEDPAWWGMFGKGAQGEQGK